MTQASAISKVFSIVIVLSVSWFGAKMLSVVSVPESDQELLLVSVSYKADEYPLDVTMSMTDAAGDHIFGTIPSMSPRHNTLTFEFPYQAHFDSLKVEFGTEQAITILSVNITCGDYHRTYRGAEIGKIFYLANSPFTLNENGDLIFVPRGDPAELVGHVRLTPGRSGSHTFEQQPLVFGLAFCLLLVIQVLAMLIHGVSGFWAVTLLSAGMSFGAMYLMELTRHDVSNATMILESEGALEENDERVVYYSRNGTFDRAIKLFPDTSELKFGSLQFHLPSKLIRHIRLDFPANETIRIRSLRFRAPPLNTEVTGLDIMQYFNQVHGIDYKADSDGVLTIETGSHDPFIQLANDKFQSDFEYVQLQRFRYPEWLGFGFFLVFLLVFSVIKVGVGSTFIVGFLMLILVPSTTIFFKSDTYRLDTEKRLANQRPVYDDELLKFAKDLSGYLDDQFGGRAKLITAWNILRVNLFGQTASSAAVVFGEDDWMFYRAEGVQEAYENKHPFPTDTLNKMARIQQERKDWLALHGIDYYLIIPPIKHAMYEEYLPKRMKKSENGAKLDQVLNHLRSNTDVDVIDLREVLFFAKEQEEGPIYYRYDSHWNLRGSFYAYEKIMEVMKERHPYFGETLKRSQFDWLDTTSIDGDLAKLLSMNEYKLRQEIVPQPKNGYCAETVESVDYPTYVSIHDVQTREIPDADDSLPKLVMSRDSYCNYLIPYLSEHFGRSVYLWTYLFETEIILEEQPDIYMMEMLERFMKDLTIDNPPIVQHELDSAKAALETQAEIVGTQR